MAKPTVRHYKDKRTGRYVTKRRWQNAKKRGDVNIVRVQERYTKPKRGIKLPPPTPPIPPAPGPLAIERLRYQSATKNRHYDVEIISKNGAVQSVRVGRRVYTQRADFHVLRHLVDAARTEGEELTPKAGAGQIVSTLQDAEKDAIAQAVERVKKSLS